MNNLGEKNTVLWENNGVLKHNIALNKRVNFTKQN